MLLARAPPRKPPLACTNSTFVPRLWMRELTACGGAVADGDQHDHRGHPDRHPEDRQARAQLVGGDPAPGDAQYLRRRSCGPQRGDGAAVVKRTSGCDRRRIVTPRRDLDDLAVAQAITRLACSATSGSWVISTTVRPSSFRPAKIRRTSSVECESRLPGRLVGEDQRRVRDDRARDRDALLLAAGELGGLVVAAGCPCPPSPALVRRVGGARRRRSPA